VKKSELMPIWVFLVHFLTEIALFMVGASWIMYGTGNPPKIIGGFLVALATAHLVASKHFQKLESKLED